MDESASHSGSILLEQRNLGYHLASALLQQPPPPPVPSTTAPVRLLPRIHLYGTVGNYMAEKVLTQHDEFPSDAVRKHLGLTGDHESESFMDM